MVDPLGQCAHFSCDLSNRFQLGRTHDWCNQTVFSSNRDADIGMLIVANCLVLKRSIDFRVLNQTYGDDLDDQIVNTEFQIRIEFIERMAHIGGALHIDLNG